VPGSMIEQGTRVCGAWKIARRRTFWLCEVALFNASLESFVEHGIKLVVRGDCQVLVVGLDIFLDRLTAVVVGLISQVPPDTNATGRGLRKPKARKLVE
jgi:hypothetical protein